jgi:hypothetical protein
VALDEVEMDGGLDDISTHARATTGTTMTLRPGDAQARESL